MDIVKDCKNFLIKIKELKLYMVEFKENSAIKDKIYLSNCAVYPIIIIIYNRYTFSVNDRIQKVWILKENIFL